MLLAVLWGAVGCEDPMAQMPKIDPTSAMTAADAKEKALPKLEPFQRRGIVMCKELIPGGTILYYMPSGRTTPEAAARTTASTWIFGVGPDSNANGTAEWMYLFVDAASAALKGVIVPGELLGLSWDEIYKKEEPMDNYTLWRAETTTDPKSSAWKELVQDWETLEAGGTHAWIRRFDSDAALQEAYAPKYEPIDWDHKTLLLVAGVEMKMNYPYDMTLAAQKAPYVVHVYRQNSWASALLWWTRAILVDKLPADAELSVETSFL